MDKLLKRFTSSARKPTFVANETATTGDQRRAQNVLAPRPRVHWNVDVEKQDVQPDLQPPPNEAAADTGETDYGELAIKLNDEAEKIRKWKVETEFELQLLNKKLVDANRTITDLRKVVSGLQQKVEEQKTEIEEDVVNHEDLMMKVASNWEICCEMQKQVSHLNEKILRCNEEKVEISKWQQEKLQLLDDLTMKYDNLKISHVEFADFMKGHVAEIEREKRGLEKNFADTIENYDNLMEDIKDQLEAELEKGLFLKDDLKSAKEEIISLQCNIENRDKEISLKDALIQELQDDKKRNGTRFQQLERQNSDLRNMLSKKKQNIAKLRREVDELSNLMVALNELKKENDNLNENIRKLQEENGALSFANASTKNDLLNEHNELDIEKNKNLLLQKNLKVAEDKLGEQVSQIENLTATIETVGKNAQVSEMNINAFKEDMSNKLVELENQLKDSTQLVEKLELEVQEKTKQFDEQQFETSELKAQLSELNAKNNTTAQNYDTQIEEMVNTLEGYKVDNEKIVAQKQKEIDELKELLELGVKHRSELTNSHQDEIIAIKEQLQSANVHWETALKEKNEFAKKLEESEATIAELKKVQQCQALEIAELKALDQSQKSILKRAVGKSVTFIKTPSPITSDNSNSDGVEIAPNVVDQFFNKSSVTYSVTKLKPLITSSPLVLKTYENRKLKPNSRMQLSNQPANKLKRQYAVDPEKRSNLRTNNPEKKSLLNKNIRLGDTLSWLEEDITMSDV